MNQIEACRKEPFFSPPNGRIIVEQIEGASKFLAFPESLKNSGCPKKMLPYPKEFDLLLEKYKSESDGLGVLIFRQDGHIIGYVPYVRRKSLLKIRMGEKHLFALKFSAVQILRPNSLQWGDNQMVPKTALNFFLKHEPNQAIRATEIHPDSPLWKSYLHFGKNHFFMCNKRPIKHHFHYFDVNYDSFLRKFKKQTRRTIKRKLKNVRHTFGSKLFIREYDSLDSVESFLDASNIISVKTYQAKLFGEVVENSYEMRKLLLSYARYGYFRSFILWIDQLPISFLLGFQTPDGVYEHAIMGYDPDWSRYSPGFCCNILLLKRLYKSNTPNFIDFGQGTNQLKQILGNRETETISPILLPKSPYGKLIYSLYSFSEATNRFIVKRLDDLGLKNRLKNYFRKRSNI